MTRLGHAVVLGGLAIGVVSAEATDLRFSGQVSAVDPGGATILVEELGPSRGPHPSVIARSVTVTARTTFAVVERIRQSDGWPGAFAETPGTAKDLRAGDFVTITARQEPGGLHAVSVSVIRPDVSR